MQQTTTALGAVAVFPSATDGVTEVLRTLVLPSHQTVHGRSCAGNKRPFGGRIHD